MIELINECSRQIFTFSAIVFTLNYQITEKANTAVGKASMGFFTVSAAVAVITLVISYIGG